MRLIPICFWDRIPATCKTDRRDTVFLPMNIGTFLTRDITKIFTIQRHEEWDIRDRRIILNLSREWVEVEDHPLCDLLHKIPSLVANIDNEIRLCENVYVHWYDVFRQGLTK